MKVFFQKSLINLSVLFLIASASFFLIYFIPGDPVDFILKDGADLQDKNLLRQELGLDKPFTQQYALFIKKLVHLDIGHSIHSKESVAGLLWEQMPFTFFLAFLSLFLAFIWGFLLEFYRHTPLLQNTKSFLMYFPFCFFLFQLL